MWYLVIIVFFICVSFFIWASVEYRKEKKRGDKTEEKPLFHTEDDLEEYGKPMNPHPVDFDDED